MFGYIAGALVLFLSIISKFNLHEKIKKMFKNVKFPSERQTTYVPSTPTNKLFLQKKND